jgi:hypothetical protein
MRGPKAGDAWGWGSPRLGTGTGEDSCQTRAGLHGPDVTAEQCLRARTCVIDPRAYTAPAGA